MPSIIINNLGWIVFASLVIMVLLFFFILPSQKPRKKGYYEKVYGRSPEEPKKQNQKK